MKRFLPKPRTNFNTSKSPALTIRDYTQHLRQTNQHALAEGLEKVQQYMDSIGEQVDAISSYLSTIVGISLPPNESIALAASYTIGTAWADVTGMEVVLKGSGRWLLLAVCDVRLTVPVTIQVRLTVDGTALPEIGTIIANADPTAQQLTVASPFTLAVSGSALVRLQAIRTLGAGSFLGGASTPGSTNLMAIFLGADR
jgi:hypothetical protein